MNGKSEHLKIKTSRVRRTRIATSVYSNRQSEIFLVDLRRPSNEIYTSTTNETRRHYNVINFINLHVVCKLLNSRAYRLYNNSREIIYENTNRIIRLSFAEQSKN